MDDEQRAMVHVDRESPLWKAWLQYKEEDSFENTRRWARDPNHTEGSLWAAFHAGWIAGCKRRYEEQKAEVLKMNRNGS